VAKHLGHVDDGDTGRSRLATAPDRLQSAPLQRGGALQRMPSHNSSQADILPPHAEEHHVTPYMEHNYWRRVGTEVYVSENVVRHICDGIKIRCPPDVSSDDLRAFGTIPILNSSMEEAQASSELVLKVALHSELVSKYFQEYLIKTSGEEPQMVAHMMHRAKEDVHNYLNAPGKNREWTEASTESFKKLLPGMKGFMVSEDAQNCIQKIEGGKGFAQKEDIKSTNSFSIGIGEAEINVTVTIDHSES